MTEKHQKKLLNLSGVRFHKICLWCVHGYPDNLETLKDEKMKGNHHKATEKYIEVLLETIDKAPQELGYEFGRLSAKRLATYLEEVTGIKLSGSQVWRIISKKKYVYLWSKYSLDHKQEPNKRKAFKEKLEQYLRIEKESYSRLQVWFWDESRFSLRVIKRKTWCKKGPRKKVRGDRRKGRVNVMGAIRYSDKKRFLEFLSKSNSNSFYKVLKLFYQDLISEWVEAGNNREDFTEKGSKIVIVLDKASFHNKQDYIHKITTEMPNIHLDYLPEYSPDYNLIELVWHSAKEYIAN